MTQAGFKLSEKTLEHFLLQFKYHAAVRRVARGVAHSYNNIFTGLGGQTAMLQHETQLLGDLSGKRGGLIGELLQRGIEQTATLYGFTRDGDEESSYQSPLLLANKTLELLNSISRIHRFTLHSKINQEKIICKARDILLILFYIGENCVDATPEGGEISLALCREENPERSISFRFRDYGPGFFENQNKSFNTPFLSARDDSPYRGLGLYAAQVLAGRYHGRLAVIREQGKATVVSATFPLAVEEKNTTSDTTYDTTLRKGGNGQTKQCFLVVEDDEAMRTLLLNRLQRRGHMVFCVDTCAEALEEYGNLHDIITTVLMDVGLPDASGYECQSKLLTVNPQTRIIFMSGQHEMAPEGEEGKSVFLQKPFTMDQLEKAVHDVHL